MTYYVCDTCNCPASRAGASCPMLSCRGTVIASDTPYPGRDQVEEPLAARPLEHAWPCYVCAACGHVEEEHQRCPKCGYVMGGHSGVGLNVLGDELRPYYDNAAGQVFTSRAQRKAVYQKLGLQRTSIGEWKRNGRPGMDHGNLTRMYSYGGQTDRRTTSERRKLTG